MKRFATVLAVTALLTGALAIPANAQLFAETTVPTMVDYGEEPRQLLRYEFVEGQTDTLRAGFTMEMSMSMDGVTIADVAIPFDSEMEFTVTEVSPDGTARIDFVYTEFDFGDVGFSLDEETLGPVPDDTDALAEMSDELAAGSELFVGITGWQVVDDMGGLQDFGLDMPEAFPDELRGQLDSTAQSVQVLPEEPVGVGARWVADMTVDSSGVPMTLIAETEVLAIEDGQVLLGTTMTMGGDLTSALLADMPASVDVDVAEMEMSGGGSSRIDLSSAMPETDMGIEMAMAFGISAEEDGVTESVDMAMDMDLRMMIEPVE